MWTAAWNNNQIAKSEAATNGRNEGRKFLLTMVTLPVGKSTAHAKPGVLTTYQNFT